MESNNLGYFIPKKKKSVQPKVLRKQTYELKTFEIG